MKNINITISKGEIVGIAGVSGNGQLELEECVAGLRKVTSGTIIMNGEDITHIPTGIRRKRGLSHIPSDRLKRGLVSSYDLAKNIILGNQDSFTKNGFLQKNDINKYCKKVMEKFDVRCQSLNDTVDNLSGGNQQKLLIGRELSTDPKFILAAQPTRGVDVGAIEFIHNNLLEMRKKNKAILLISAELEELLSLADRILVIYEGEIVSKKNEYTKEELGLFMAGKKVHEEDKQEIESRIQND